MLGAMLKIGGVLVLVAAGAIGFTLQTTGEMIVVAEQFRTAAADDAREAGLELVSSDRRSWGGDALAAFWTMTRLDQAGTFTWNHRSYRGGLGRLVGIAPIAGGGHLEIDLDFRNSEGRWLIDRYTARLSAETEAAPAAIALFAETRQRLAATVRNGSYGALLRDLSTAYRTQMTQVGLERLLRQVAARSGVLVNRAVPAGPLRTGFDNGLLDLGQTLRTMHGLYDLRIVFAYEDGHWKTDGLRVDRLEESP